MGISFDGQRIRLAFDAAGGEGSIVLKDGDRTLFDGAVGRLSLEVDAASFGVPEALTDLLGQSLPPLSDYSTEAFTPLDLPFIGLATLRFTGSTGRWTEPAVLGSQLLPLPLMAGAIHYAQSVFEGSKVYFVRTDDGLVARTFRNEMNAARMWRSAIALGIPLDKATIQGATGYEAFRALYGELVQRAVSANVEAGLFEGDFAPLDPRDPGFSFRSAPAAVYVRPVLFASGPVLGVKPADHYTFGVYVTPVGKYRADLVLKVERDKPRAWPGGTGAAKAACNYAPTLPMMAALKANKKNPPAGSVWTDLHDDILFLDTDGNVEEMGGANFFVIEAQADGPPTLRTPPALHDDPNADRILPGVTRASVLAIGETMGLDVRVEELPLGELIGKSDADKRQLAVFTTGTAAAIAPVLALNDGGTVHQFAAWDSVHDDARLRAIDADDAPEGSALAAGHRLRELLFRVQLGVLTSDDAALARETADWCHQWSVNAD